MTDMTGATRQYDPRVRGWYVGGKAKYEAGGGRRAW